jgi:hypothetical protein
MPIADHQLGGRQPATLEIAQDRRPALDRFSIPVLDGKDHLVAVAQRGQHDEDRRLVLLEAGLHVHAVHPEVDDLKIRDRAGLPEVVLGVRTSGAINARTERRHRL